MIYDIIREYEMASGRKLTPKNTDIEDTYAWRHISKFADRMKAVNADWNTVREIIHYTIKYARKHNIRNEIDILSKEDIIDKCCELQKSDIELFDIDIATLQKSKEFMGSNDDTLDEYNLIRWYNRGKISMAYLALSKSCNILIRKMDKDLIDFDKIINMRNKYFIYRDRWNAAKKILGDDMIDLLSRQI